MTAPRGRQLTAFGGFLDPFAIGSSSPVEAVYPPPVSADTGTGGPSVYAPVEVRDLVASTDTGTSLGKVILERLPPDIIRGKVYVRTSKIAFAYTRLSVSGDVDTRTKLKEQVETRTSLSDKAFTRVSPRAKSYTRTVESTDEEL